MSNTEQCSNCRFWDDEMCGVGMCRRHAPAAGSCRTATWPRSRPDDWCGEHEPIESEETMPDETLDDSRPAEDDGAL